MSVAITAQIPESAALYLRQRAEQQHRALDEVLAEVIEEGRRMAEFPGIVFGSRPNGQRKSRVEGGMDVWEYAMIARDYLWSVPKTAAHLGITERLVELALAYYRAYPDEVDQRLRELDAPPEEPAWLQGKITRVMVPSSEADAAAA